MAGARCFGHDRVMPRKPPSPDASSTDETSPDETSTESTGANASDSTEPTVAPDPVTPPPPGPTAQSGAGYRFFSWIRSLDLRREPGWIGGVCAGIAVRLGIDPLIVRGIAVVIAVLGGPAILLYAAAWLLLPDANDKIHLEQVIRGVFEPAIAGIGALFVLSLLPVAQGFWFLGAGFWGEPHWGDAVGRALWTTALIALAVWFVIWMARRTPSATIPPSAPPAPSAPSTAAFVASATTVTSPAAPTSGATEPEVAEWREQQARVQAEKEAFRNQQASDRAAAQRAAQDEARRHRSLQRERESAQYAASRSHPLYSLVVIGLALVAGGLATVSFGAGELTATAAVVGLSVMLAVLALGIIINGIRGKRSGGAAGVSAIVLVGLLAAGSASGDISWVRWGATSVVTPTTSQNISIGAGRVELDLTQVKLSTSGAGLSGEDIRLTMGAGQVTVIIPDDASVQFTSSVAAGAIDAGPNEQSSRIGPIENVFAEFGDPNDPPLIVTVQLGAGQVRVVEAGDNR